MQAESDRWVRLNGPVKTGSVAGTSTYFISFHKHTREMQLADDAEPLLLLLFKIQFLSVTGPGRLSCQYIIHAVGPMCFRQENMEKKDKELRSAVHNSLAKAEEMGLKSISLPGRPVKVFYNCD